MPSLWQLIVTTDGRDGPSPMLRTETTPNAKRDGIGTRSALAADAAPAVLTREIKVAAATSVLRIFMDHPPAHALERAGVSLFGQSLGRHDACHATFVQGFSAKLEP